ncbi:hypothetical protein QR680_014790 [Steinernema hermaphroditum]|uniref:C2 domain-containing protein n=1 Tax=Steinernema hermaphroditum TaxID=289476 RepID=A0AA39IBP7_9BILA|nr:hypothetical protein QR680_014790 [Steinernema hermaphroditum]
MSPSTAMLIFTLLHTSAVNNDRRSEDAEDVGMHDICSKFTPRKEIRELSSAQVNELVDAFQKFDGHLNYTTIGESLDTVLFSANLSFSFPYWDFRFESLNPFESAFLSSMEKSRLSTLNTLWLSKLLFDYNRRNEAETLLDTDLRDLKKRAQQWIRVLQFGNIWQAMVDVMVEELISTNGTESYDLRSAWLYQDRASNYCFGKAKIGSKCSSSEMCYRGTCVKGYCRLFDDDSLVVTTTAMTQVENRTVAKGQKKARSGNSTSVLRASADNETVKEPSKHRHSSHGHIIQWNESVSFPIVYISVTVIEGKLRSKKRTQNRADNYTIHSVGRGNPEGYDHVLEGRPMVNETNALIRVLNPENILPFVEFRVDVFNKRGERCRQRCLSTRRRGYYRRCKRESVRLTMYEAYSDPVQWYKSEVETISQQWVGRGYYKKRKLDYLLFKCNP